MKYKNRKTILEQRLQITFVMSCLMLWHELEMKISGDQTSILIQNKVPFI